VKISPPNGRAGSVRLSPKHCPKPISTRSDSKIDCRSVAQTAKPPNRRMRARMCGGVSGRSRETSPYPD